MLGPNTPQVLTLENEQFICRILPLTGGAIHSFDCKLTNGKTQPLLRHTANDQTTDVLDLSSWPLIPFSNRIKYGTFTFDAQKHEITKNYLGGPNSIHASHGQGWQFPWKVESVDQTQCTLSFTFDPTNKDMAGLWPFPYTARQTFALSDKGLTITFSVTNTGNKTMPAGLGMHPYFPKIKGTTLQAKVGKLWEIDEEVIPKTQVAVPEEYNFITPKSLDEARLDSCFSGYGGMMQIVWPERDVALNLETSPNLDHFVVYTPFDGDFFCAEPVSHKPDAINDEDPTASGLVLLAPGQTEQATYTYEALRKAESLNAPQNLSLWKALAT